MPIGARLGGRLGTFPVRLGAPKGGSPLASVTKDALSGIYTPANASEWASAMTAASIGSGGPSALYLLQDASGNPSDSIGSFTLTAAGTGLSYQQAVSGWTRAGVKFTDAGTGSLSNTSASLPDVSTTSHMLLLYLSMPAAAPAAQRNLCIIGSTGASLRLNTTPRINFVTATSVIGSSNPTGAVRPLVIRIDRAAGTVTGFTDQEKIIGSITGRTGKAIVIGNASFNSAGAVALYAASFHAAAAELTDAKIKTLLQTLGWTIAWT